MNSSNHSLKDPGTTSGAILFTQHPIVAGILYLSVSATFMLGYSTTSSEPFEKAKHQASLLDQSTHSGFTPDVEPVEHAEAPAIAQSTSSATSELRMLSGLTWEKLADIFGVSRRSLHLWVSGESLNEENETRLRATLSAIRKIDRGSAALNRALLLTPNDAGQSPIELLQNREYSKFTEQLGEGAQRPATKRSPLSDEAKAARKPLPPDILIAANSDPAPPTPGRLLSARPLRPKHDEG